jgi:DUF4097 and DUF4098 domain-containing protein YvlB
MKDDIKRIMKLVQEGKISPEDAAELIEALGEARRDDEESGPGEPEKEATARSGDDPFSKLFGAIDKISKDVSKNVNWEEISAQLRQGVGKGVDAIKQAAEEARRSSSFSFVFGSQHSKHVELPLNLGSGQTLRIDLAHGDVKVVATDGPAKVVVDATIRAHNDEEAKRLIEAYTPVVEESESAVVMRQPDTPQLVTDMVFHVPTGVPLEVKVSNGDVSVEGTQSSCRIQGSRGDVALTGLDGPVEVVIQSGDVKVAKTKATILTVETKSGDVKLEETSGILNVKTASGDVDLARCAPRTLSVEAASSDIRADLVEPVEGTVNVRTVSGDVLIEVVDGSDCRVSLSSLRGSASSKIDLEDANVQPQKVTGRLGNGSGTIDASTISGDVRLQLRNSAV